MTPSQDYLTSMALIIGGAMTVSLAFGILLGAVFAPALGWRHEDTDRRETGGLGRHRSSGSPSSRRADR